MITKNLIEKIQNPIENHESQLFKLNLGELHVYPVVLLF